jgi:hypothetical protein
MYARLDTYMHMCPNGQAAARRKNHQMETKLIKIFEGH